MRHGCGFQMLKAEQISLSAGIGDVRRQTHVICQLTCVCYALNGVMYPMFTVGSKCLQPPNWRPLITTLLTRS